MSQNDRVKKVKIPETLKQQAKNIYILWTAELKFMKLHLTKKKHDLRFI